MLNNGGDGRDNRGRWKKGFCPNPNGRPRKELEISDADVGHFKQRMVEVTINGEKRLLTRHELLLHSMYEQAIKGKSVLLARKLLDRFEDVDMTLAKARDWLRENRLKFVDDYVHGKRNNALANEILELQEMLNYGRKAKRQRKPRSRRKSPFANFRKGPKPQSLLDLEAKEEAEILAEERARALRLGLPVEPQDAGNDEDDAG